MENYLSTFMPLWLWSVTFFLLFIISTIFAVVNYKKSRKRENLITNIHDLIKANGHENSVQTDGQIGLVKKIITDSRMELNAANIKIQDLCAQNKELKESNENYIVQNTILDLIQSLTDPLTPTEKQTLSVHLYRIINIENVETFRSKDTFYIDMLNAAVSAVKDPKVSKIKS